MSNKNLYGHKTANRLKLNDDVRRDIIDANHKGGIYVIMAGKRITVRLDDEIEQKVEELRQELEEQYKIDISVTDVIRRSIVGLYEELDLGKDNKDKQ